VGHGMHAMRKKRMVKDRLIIYNFFNP